MLVDNRQKKSEQKSIIGSGPTERNDMSTSKMSTSKERIDIRIPKSSKIYQFLYVDNKQTDLSKWRQLDNLVNIATEMRDDWAEKIFDDFVFRMSSIFPEKKDKWKRLRALILWQMVWGDKQPPEYYKKLEDL